MDIRDIFKEKNASKSLKQLQEEWFEENAPLGRALGYPDCCIKEFCDQPPVLLKQRKKASKEDIRRYRAGCIGGKFTGFVPCNQHAIEIVSGRITLQSLISNRSLKFPTFPKYATNDFV